MLERKDDLHCTISATEVRDDGVTLHCMTNMDDYGKVRFSLTLVSAASPDRSGGIDAFLDHVLQCGGRPGAIRLISLWRFNAVQSHSGSIHRGLETKKQYETKYSGACEKSRLKIP